MNFYNEFDPSAAAWLRELIAQRLIPAGVVDERSITEIQPHELSGYAQCHFFCGIAGWPLALQLAGWPPARPVGTGSCPCQPYSTAGKGLGDKDPRNLWPAFRDLILGCRNLGQPWAFTVFGEQVESAIGHGWLDGVSADMEAENYAVGAVVLGAHSVLAPHIRQRLYWVADHPGGGRGIIGNASRTGSSGHADSTGGASGGMVHADSHGRSPWEPSPATAGHRDTSEPASDDRGMADDSSGRREMARLHDGISAETLGVRQTDLHRGGRAPHFWDDSQWICCRDGKHRRVPTQPALFPLADGLPYKLARRWSIRPALLKGAGNAIVPQAAAAFIQAFLESLQNINP